MNWDMLTMAAYFQPTSLKWAQVITEIGFEFTVHIIYDHILFATSKEASATRDWLSWIIILFSEFCNCPFHERILTNLGLNICMSGSATSCEECLLLHPSCAWCAQEVRTHDVHCVQDVLVLFVFFSKIETMFRTTTVFFSFHRVSRFISFGWYWATGSHQLFVPQDFGRGRTLTSRCDFLQNLRRRGCGTEYIEYPTSSVSVLRNMPLSSKGSDPSRVVVQIMPQDVSLKLRPGGCCHFSESASQTRKNA